MNDVVYGNSRRMFGRSDEGSLSRVCLEHMHAAAVHFRYDSVTGLILSFSARPNKGTDEAGWIKLKRKNDVMLVGAWDAETTDARVRAVLEESFREFERLGREKATVRTVTSQSKPKQGFFRRLFG